MVKVLLLSFVCLWNTACAARPSARTGLFDGATDRCDDALLADRLQRTLDADAAIRTAWPGFWPMQSGLGLTSGESTALIVRASKPSGAVGVDRVVCVSGLDRLGSGMVVQAKFGERPYLIVDLDGAPGGIASSFRMDAFIFHEIFHEYQATWSNQGNSGLPTLSEPLVAQTVVEDPGFQARVVIEGAVLAAALRAPSALEKRRLLGDFAALRAERRKGMPRDARNAEGHIERKEGTAHWVGYRVAHALSRDSMIALDERLADELSAGQGELKRGAVQGRFRSHLYATGAGIAQILDGLGADWRRPLEAGHDFDGVMGATLALDSVWMRQRAAALLDEYGFESRRRDIEIRLGPGVVPLESFSAGLGQPRLEIRGFAVSRTESAGESYLASPTSTIFSRPEHLEISGPAGRIHLSGVPVLIDRTEASVVVVVLPSTPIPLPMGSDSMARLPALRWTGAGIDIDLGVPVVIERTENRVTVRVLSVPPR
jgi:hypothetical protein